MSVSLDKLLVQFHKKPEGTFIEYLKKVEDMVGVKIEFGRDTRAENLKLLSKSDLVEFLQHYFDNFVVTGNYNGIYTLCMENDMITLQHAKDILEKVKSIKNISSYVIENFDKYIAKHQRIEDAKNYEELKVKCAKLETEFEEYKAKNSKIEVELGVAVKDLEAKMAEKDEYIKYLENFAIPMVRYNGKLLAEDDQKAKGLSKKDKAELILKEHKANVDELLRLRSEREDQTKTITDLNAQIQELTAYKDQLSGIQNAYKNLTTKF